MLCAHARLPGAAGQGAFTHAVEALSGGGRDQVAGEDAATKCSHVNQFRWGLWCVLVTPKLGRSCKPAEPFPLAP